MADVVESGIDAAAEAFKRMHGNVCYPSASDGEAKWAAEEIVKAYLGSARLSHAGAGGAWPRGVRISFSEAEYGVGNAVISPDDDSDGPYWTLIGGGSNEEQNRLAAFIVEAVNPRASALAPSPSAGEPVAEEDDAGFVAAFLRIAAQRRDVPESVRRQIVRAAELLATPPEPVQTASVEAIADLIDSIAKCHSENAMDRAFLDNSDEIAAAVLKLIADRDGEWACTVNRLEDEIAAINPAPGHGEGVPVADVTREALRSADILTERAHDPMWDAHAEVSKRTLLKAAQLLVALAHPTGDKEGRS